jgi:hypothetical protein
MRNAIPSILLLAIAAGCFGGGNTASVATTGVGPPRLKPPLLPTTAGPKSVARFRCPKRPISSVDLQSCAARRVLALNAKINERSKVIWSRLGGDTGRRYFMKSERAWRAYVVKQCTSRSRAWIDPAHPHTYVGGTAAPVVFAACQEELTLSHLREATETERALGPR